MNTRPDIAALVLILVFGAFVNAAGMTEPVMMWMHLWHARLSLNSLVPIVTALYLVGLLMIPGLLAAACGWISRYSTGTGVSWKDLTCSFTLTLVPVGFSMWLVHFSTHLLAGWSTGIPAIERFILHSASVRSPLAWSPSWLLSLDFVFLDLGLLLTLYSAWRVARRVSKGGRMALAVVSPWVILASLLYAAGIWILLQPMQMRGMT